MFDRYLGDNTSRVAASEKMYRLPDGRVYLPSLNIMSFLSAENTRSAPKVLLDRRQYKDKAAALLSNTSITPAEIVLMRRDDPIQWLGEFDDGPGGPSGIVLHHSVARLPKGIPNPKARPLVLAPWWCQFTVSLFPNDSVQPDELRWIVEQGMWTIGLGTYRGVFGKALVEWAEV